MKHEWLEDFLALYQTGNFNTASESRHISQSAYSRRIKALEEWVGADLFSRFNQPVTLTDAGELFLPTAKELLRIANQSRVQISLQNKFTQQKISILTLHTLAQFFIPSWLKTLRSDIPIEPISIKTDLEKIEDFFSTTAKGEVDFYIGYEHSASTVPLDNTILHSLQLGTETLVPVVSPNIDGQPSYWLPSQAKGSNIPYLQTETSLSLWPIQQHLQTHYSHLNFNTVYESAAVSAVKAMVLEDYGVAWVPKSMVRNDLKNKVLVRAAPCSDDIPINIIIYRRKSTLSNRAESLWKALMNDQDSD